MAKLKINIKIEDEKDNFTYFICFKYVIRHKQKLGIIEEVSL